MVKIKLQWKLPVEVTSGMVNYYRDNGHVEGIYYTDYNADGTVDLHRFVVYITVDFNTFVRKFDSKGHWSIDSKDPENPVMTISFEELPSEADAHLVKHEFTLNYVKDSIDWEMVE